MADGARLSVEALADLCAANSVLATTVAWQRFKSSHDVASVKVCCCEKTRQLFDSLDALEKEILAVARG